LLRDFNDTLHQQLDDLTDWLKKNDGDSSAKAIRHFLLTWQPVIYGTSTDNISNNTNENNNYALQFRNHSLAKIKQVKFDNSDQLIMRFATWQKGGVLRFNLDLYPPLHPATDTTHPSTSFTQYISHTHTQSIKPFKGKI
jgi:uncharacterized protein YfdQ (DUF2303 family)